MPKDRSRRDLNLRRHLAYLAARLMAEDGGLDYASAKWKAARQAGLSDDRLLPDNQEIELALREYQSLYQRDEQPAQLRRLREVAVKVMRKLEEFRPVLVGSVLSGTAGHRSDVNLQLYTDDAKMLTLFLLNRQMRFEEGSRRIRRGDQLLDVPQFRLQVDGIPVTLTVLGHDDERFSRRGKADADAPLRARLAEVEALLGTTGSP
jgi:predicted nucleotidyltransferase